MNLSNSEIETYLSCPGKHRWKYGLRLEGWAISQPLVLGTLVHTGVAAYNTQENYLAQGFSPVGAPVATPPHEPLLTPLDAAFGEIKKEAIRINKDLTERREGSPRPLTQSESTIVDLGRHAVVALALYDQWGQKPRGKHLHIEIPGLVEVGASTGNFLNLKIDSIFESVSGSLYVNDMKATGYINPTRWNRSSQLTGYVYAARKALQNDTIQATITAFNTKLKYDAVPRGQKKPRVSFDASGRPDVREADADEFWTHFYVNVSQKELDWYEKWFNVLCERIRDSRRTAAADEWSDIHYLNPGSCEEFMGYPCEFQALCWEGLDENLDRYKRREAFKNV